MMKNKISFLILLLITVFGFTACDEEEDAFLDPTRLAIGGPASVTPGTSRTYTIGSIANAEGYTWAVEGPAQIVGGATGNTVTVQFQSVGRAVLTATNGSDTGRLTINVTNTRAAVETVLDTTATGELKALSRGQSDTVFFEFAAPVEGAPALEFIESEDENGNMFKSGTLGPLQKQNDRTFYTIYTAGDGNGTPNAVLRNIVSTAAYGAVKTDSVLVELFRVDNIAPVASLTYSSEFIKSGSPITVTATFSEAVMPGTNGETLFATLTGAGISKRLPLEPTEGNPLVYTLMDTLITTETGQITVNLENAVDFAGNQLTGVSNRTFFYVDNIAPVVTGTATDAGNYASISLRSTNSGTVMYVIANAGTAAPETAEEFTALEGVASRTVEFTSGNQTKTVAQALTRGSYVVFFMATDKAGNTSGITSAALTMD